MKPTLLVKRPSPRSLEKTRLSALESSAAGAAWALLVALAKSPEAQRAPEAFRNWRREAGQIGLSVESVMIDIYLLAVRLFGRLNGLTFVRVRT